MFLVYNCLLILDINLGPRPLATQIKEDNFLICKQAFKILYNKMGFSLRKYLLLSIWLFKKNMY